MAMGKWRRRAAALVAAGVLGTTAVLTAGTACAAEMESEHADTGTMLPEEETEGEGLLAKLPDTVTADTLAEYLERLKQVDTEKVKEDLNLILEVVSSEDFQGLFSYEEVRDFAAFTVEKVYELAAEDPVLTRKVCLTLGVDEVSVEIGLIILKYFDENKEEMIELLGSDDGRAAVETAKQLAADPEIVGTALNIAKALGMMSSEQEQGAGTEPEPESETER